MDDVVEIEDHMSWVCACGEVDFNLLKSRKIQCPECGRIFGRWTFIGSDALPSEVGRVTPLKDNDEQDNTITI